MNTRKLTAAVAAILAAAALSSCGADSTDPTQPDRPTGKELSFAAGVEAAGDYRRQGCGAPTDWQAAAYAAAKAASPRVFAADGLSDAMCADQAEVLPTGGEA